MIDRWHLEAGMADDPGGDHTLFDKRRRRWLNRGGFVLVVFIGTALVWGNQVRAAAADIWNSLRSIPAPPPALALVRATVQRTGTEPDLPVLELTVRNKGQEVLVITRAKVTVLSRWRIGPTWIEPLVTPVSQEYDVGVPAAPGESATTQLTQELRPQTADRFRLTLYPLPHETAWDPPFGLFVFLLQVELQYNEAPELLQIPTLYTHIPPPVSVLASTDVGPNLPALRSILQTAMGARAAVPRAGLVDEVSLNALERAIGELEETMQSVE